MAITRVRELEEELSEKIVRPRTQIILRRKCVSTICTKSQFGIVCRRIQNRLRSSRKKWAEKWCFYSERNRSTNATMVQMNSRSFFRYWERKMQRGASYREIGELFCHRMRKHVGRMTWRYYGTNLAGGWKKRLTEGAGILIEVNRITKIILFSRCQCEDNTLTRNGE